MAKVKVCLDTPCKKYYFLDDGRAVSAPKDECEVKKFAKNPKSLGDFKKRHNDNMRNATKVITMSDDPGWREGDDAVL